MSEPPRVAVVTGVSRRQGIGYAIARRLLADGLNVMIHSWAPHDAEQLWSPDPGEQNRRRVPERLRGWWFRCRGLPIRPIIGPHLSICPDLPDRPRRRP